MTTTGEQRVIQIPAEPDFGPATPGGTGRASFGFSDGPISPVRQSPEPELPVRRKKKAGEPPAVAEALPPPGPASWPPPERVDRVDLERVPGDSAPAGASPGWADFTSGGASPASGEQGFTSGDDDFESGGADYASRGVGEITGERRVERREPPAADPAPPRQSRMVTLGIVLLSVVVLLAGTIVGAVYFSGSDGKLDSVLELGAGDSGQRSVTAPLDNRTAASFELLAGTNQVRVSIGELGDDLYRISTPEDAGIRPSPEIRNDDVKLQVIRDGDGIGGEIEVVLAAKVRWSLRFSGYAEQQILDLTGGQVSGIEMVAGTRRAELSLAQPAGTVPVKINGAVEELLVKSPAASPVRVRVDGGAKTVVAGSRTLKDVPAGSTLTPKNWATQNRYDVAAGARITSLTVESA